MNFKPDKDETDPVAVLRIVLEADENQLAHGSVPVGERAAPYAASQVVGMGKRTVYVELATPQVTLDEQKPGEEAVAHGQEAEGQAPEAEPATDVATADVT